MREKIKLSGVPETMLQTVYARAKESNGRGAIHDTKAEELIEKLDYDFSLADKDTAMRSGVIARTIVLDNMYLTETDVQHILAVMSHRFEKAAVFVETMNPMIVKRFKEKSIDASNAKFTWGREEWRSPCRIAAGLPIYRRT